MSIFKILLRKIFTAINIALLIGSGFMYGLFGNHGAMCGFENTGIWETSPESGFEISLSKEFTTEGKRSLKVVYPASDYPSINTKKLPRLWWNYNYFAIDIYNPQNEKINFVIRLDDMKGRRSNIKRSLSPGWNNIIVPRSEIRRAVHPNLIKFVVLFIERPNTRYTLYFDNMRLMKQGLDRGPKTIDHRPLTVMKVDLNTPVNENYEKISMGQGILPNGEMKVYIARISPEKNKELLVSSGVPFAPGQLTDERNLCIFDPNGNEISIAAKVLARWPFDNSIRSLLVQFPIRIEHNFKTVIMRWGAPRSSADLQLIEASPDMPDAVFVLQAGYLCASKIMGEQVPVGRQPFPKYDSNIGQYLPGYIAKPYNPDTRTSGYYDKTHVLYQIYARTGDINYFIAARRNAVLYRENEVVKDGPERGRNALYPETRYVYVQAMADDYLFTGDERSLRMAGYMAEYLKKNFPPEKAFFPAKAKNFWTERNAAFPLIGMMTYYELTGNKEYLKVCSEIVKNLYRTQMQWPGRGGFIHNLYSHDPEEGARPDEYGGSPFMTGLLLEGIVKYHYYTGSDVAKKSIFKALDWLMKECVASDNGNSFVYTTADSKRDEGCPDLNLLIAHAFGYGYKISDGARLDYLEFGKKIFEEGVNSAYFGDWKHFNQNYRSSGPFLAYINRPQTIDHRP
ncbi:MAG: hypothetical protein Q8O01_03570 [Candidatus Omnitrophota bacterium]|nr:hypothetical protein [Candidatus Omnitrophota bacterium]